jgi:hypothetical protein
MTRRVSGHELGFGLGTRIPLHAPLAAYGAGRSWVWRPRKICLGIGLGFGPGLGLDSAHLSRWLGEVGQQLGLGI